VQFGELAVNLITHRAERFEVAREAGEDVVQLSQGPTNSARVG
jgi:hypothetical protein